MSNDVSNHTTNVEECCFNVLVCWWCRCLLTLGNTIITKNNNRKKGNTINDDQSNPIIINIIIFYLEGRFTWWVIQLTCATKKILFFIQTGQKIIKLCRLCRIWCTIKKITIFFKEAYISSKIKLYKII
jgi:hypothetical protein